MIRIATAILAAASLVGCESVSDSPLVLESDLWVAECPTNTPPELIHPELDGGSSSLEFLRDGQLQGFTCCNSFFGRYATKDKDSVHRIQITIEGMTLALCPHSDREQVYIEKLKQVRSYAVHDGQLNLMDSTGTVALTFIPASTTQKKQ